jgi:predicted nucleic acid-binding protein
VILVDTNTWISHVRESDPKLVHLLEQNRVVTCNVVIGEFLLGSGLPQRLNKDLPLLPIIPSPSAFETRRFVERHVRIFRSSGVGWADSQILVAATNAGALVYSSDRAVQKVWRQLGFRPG